MAFCRMGSKLWEADLFSYAGALHGLDWSAVGHIAFLLRFAHDSNSICHSERLPQQAPEYSDGSEHRSFPAAAHLHDDNVERLLYREGQRRINPTDGDATPGVADIQLARLLPRENPRHTRSDCDRAQLVVWRPL